MIPSLKCLAQVRVPDSVPQQHDRLEARPAGLAGGGGGRQTGPRGCQWSPAVRGEEKGLISHQLFTISFYHQQISSYRRMIKTHITRWLTDLTEKGPP